MLVQIIPNTPIWVFILFLALMVLGYIQSRDRTLTKAKVIILPFIMVVFSFWGVYSTTGPTITGLIPWATGLVLTTLIAQKVIPKNIAEYMPEIKTFTVSGSWYPMILIMAIFLTKYFVGVLTGMNNPIIFTTGFITSFSFLNGCFSGAFLARSIVILQKSRL